MTYAWQDRNDNRLASRPIMTVQQRKALQSKEVFRWKQALRAKAGEGASAPRRFSWEKD